MILCDPLCDPELELFELAVTVTVIWVVIVLYADVVQITEQDLNMDKEDDGLGDADAFGVTVEVVEMDGVVEIVVNMLGELNGDNDAVTLAELHADRVSSVVLDGDNPGDGVTVTDTQDDALCVVDSVEDIDADDDSLLGGDCV